MKIRPEPRLGWLAEWDVVSNDPYVRTKVRRNIRIREIMDFINYYIPELRGLDKPVVDIDSIPDFEIEKEKKMIIDVGPGLCEFLEIARCYGHDILGVDAEFDTNVMGNEYLTACKLMAERQEVPVDYSGFDTWVKKGFPFPNESIDIINSIGSLDFVLREFMTGPSGEEVAKVTSTQTYVFDDKLHYFLFSLFAELERTLKPGGCFMVHSNAADNQEQFAEMLLIFVERNFTKIKCTISDKMNIFKFVKVV